MKNDAVDIRAGGGFAFRITYELKRAERYRIFLSLVVLNLGPILDLAGNGSLTKEEERDSFLSGLHEMMREAVREVDTVSNGGRMKIGLLLPETSRQGAEATAKRVSETLYRFCTDYFRKPADYYIPIEISSFPDAAGTRSIASYVEEFTE